MVCHMQENMQPLLQVSSAKNRDQSVLVRITLVVPVHKASMATETHHHDVIQAA